MIRRIDGSRQKEQNSDGIELFELEDVIQEAEASGHSLSEKDIKDTLEKYAEEAVIETHLLQSKDGQKIVSSMNYLKAKSESVLESGSVAKNSFRRF
jgi:hypothetical protein